MATLARFRAGADFWIERMMDELTRWTKRQTDPNIADYLFTVVVAVGVFAVLVAVALMQDYAAFRLPTDSKAFTL